MKRIIIALFSITVILSIFIFSSPSPIYSHPMDTSQLKLYLFKDEKGEDIQRNRIVGTATFNWLQLSAMTKRNENPIDIHKDIQQLDVMFVDFMKQHIIFKNNEKQCSTNFKRIIVEDVETVIVDGIKYEIEVTCEEEIKTLKIENTAFKDEIATQSNTIVLLNYDKTLVESRETPVEYTVDINKETQNGSTDTKLIIKVINWFKDITSLNATTPTYLILLTVYLVGILHAFEGGHNKLILGSLIINKKVQLKQAFIYTIIFTLTHISDIILLSIGLVVLDRYIDIYSIFPNLRVITLLILFILSLYWLGKELKHIYLHRKNNEHDHHELHTHNHDETEKSPLKSQLTIAFISGLAPCITGWSIFMLLFSSGRTNLLIPGNIVFGLGVFTVLIIYTLILLKTKNIILEKAKWLSEYSTLISAGLILLSTLISLINIAIS